MAEDFDFNVVRFLFDLFVFVKHCRDSVNSFLFAVQLEEIRLRNRPLENDVLSFDFVAV